MTLAPHDCERCGARVRQQGDHLCPSCAEALGRDVRDPFWGSFKSHPDSKLLPSATDRRAA